MSGRYITTFAAHYPTRIKAASTKSLVEEFAGTDHGFCFAERAVYAPEAAETSWARLFDLWERNLK
jgi:carboxymethylenebutenolidase